MVGTEPSLDLGEAMLGPVELDPGRLQGLTHKLQIRHSFRFIKIRGCSNVVSGGKSNWIKRITNFEARKNGDTTHNLWKTIVVLKQIRDFKWRVFGAQTLTRGRLIPVTPESGKMATALPLPFQKKGLGGRSFFS